MLYLLGVLVIAFGVAASIALHEIGHLVPAKRFGVKCTQYMVGFGPTVWSRTRGETEYGFKAIPLGGYVRMIGMFPPKPGQHPREGSTGRWALMIQQAREDAQREVGDEDAGRLFYQRTVPQRLVIMLGGPVMNLVIAVVLLGVLVTGFGLRQLTPTLSSVSACILPTDAPADRQCTPADRPAPAAAAGLRPGDVITAFDGRAVDTWDDVRRDIRRSGDRPVTLTVRRDGGVLDVRVTPVSADRPRLDADGRPVVSADGRLVTERVGFLGVSPSEARVRQSPAAVPGIVADQVLGTARLILQIPQKMVGVAKAAFGSGERDPNGPVSIVGIGRFAGEVASRQSTAVAPVGWGDKAAGILSLIASLNLALFVFNLVPLLPLDGGHVAGALWEGLRRRLAFLRGRPDPGPVDVARGLPIAYGVASVLIAMSILLIWADLVRPIRLNG